MVSLSRSPPSPQPVKSLLRRVLLGAGTRNSDCTFAAPRSVTMANAVGRGRLGKAWRQEECPSSVWRLAVWGAAWRREVLGQVCRLGQAGFSFPPLSPFFSLSNQNSNDYINRLHLNQAGRPHCAAWKVRMAQREDGVEGRVFVWQRSWVSDGHSLAIPASGLSVLCT